MTVARVGNRAAGGTTSLIRHLQILRTVTEAVSRSLDLTEVIQKSLSALTHVTGHEIASLHLVSSDGKMLLLRGERGLSPRLREVNEVLPIGQGLIGRVAATGRVRRVDEAGRAPDLLPAARAAVSADGIRGFLCVPIRARHRILGTLSLGRQTEERFSGEEIALLESTADQIGLALDNARLYSETRLQLEELRRSHTDVVRAERLAAVGELAGGVAHEINNPLMIILGQVHLLLQSQDHESVLNGLKVIDGATKRAANIVRELVLFAERSPLRRARCKVSDQIYKVLALHQSRLEGARITVQTDFHEVPEIWADGNQLQEALFHLVQNAEQAMSAARGGGILTVRVRPGHDGVRIEVADDGPGVPPDDLARVFNPFFTTKGPGEGRGLGLSVAHSVVAEHEGRLWAENRPGGGAVFVMELPVGVPTGDSALAPSA
ncbi:MAG TPA: ATP-binding protein [Methylomirabilota bacterium]|nr:ATP-binding protein [Methylomirabilota bacterium]